MPIEGYPWEKSANKLQAKKILPTKVRRSSYPRARNKAIQIIA
ncbi:hypothetical protein [Tengunoibacter tsumagoiensis]|nr:hypothetical protein [Tengunoibacter tsumagoiensis]